MSPAGAQDGGVVITGFSRVGDMASTPDERADRAASPPDLTAAGDGQGEGSATTVSGQAGSDHQEDGEVVFSPREKALVELLAAGHTDASAARRLGVSPRTISYTLQSLMDRLDVENRFQLGLALGTLGAHETDGAAPDAAQDRPPQTIEE